ncbi:putative WPP domain-associated protein [Capsicum annuum]|nr:putative WPP domain-associated protein [Capsicum annuum]
MAEEESVSVDEELNPNWKYKGKHVKHFDHWKTEKFDPEWVTGSSRGNSLLQKCKIDQLLESGESFLSDEKKLAKQREEKQVKQAEKVAENKKKIGTSFCLPEKKVKEFRKQKSTDKIDAEEFIAGLSKQSKKKSKSSR